mmetsp:Transcript_338/g.384  ORF Transcript_338/g.384 Transcript_338/m.384 type:complete len:80 (-) Transcript_338:819-1058(-)
MSKFLLSSSKGKPAFWTRLWILHKAKRWNFTNLQNCPNDTMAIRVRRTASSPFPEVEYGRDSRAVASSPSRQQLLRIQP